MTRYTGQFYISVFEAGSTPRHQDRRLFIGTTDEAMEEFQEEYKALFPDDFDRKDARFWQQRRIDLTLSVGNSAQVMGRDMLGNKIIRIERYGPMKEED